MLLKNAIILAAIWFVLLPSPAHAYFDLGVGTYMIQLIAAFTVGYWLSARQFWKKRFGKKEESSLVDSQAPVVEPPVAVVDPQAAADPPIDKRN